MKDQPSISDDRSEPPRPVTIPDDFIWNTDDQAWYAPSTPSDYDAEAASIRLRKICAETPFAGLISRDELLAAGALKGAKTGRKSLAVERPKPNGGQRELF